jgi:hypothetical protein
MTTFWLDAPISHMPTLKFCIQTFLTVPPLPRPPLTKLLASLSLRTATWPNAVKSDRCSEPLWLSAENSAWLGLIASSSECHCPAPATVAPLFTCSDPTL